MAKSPSELTRKVLQNVRTTKTAEEIPLILSGQVAMGEIAVQLGDYSSGVSGTSLWVLGHDGETAVQFVNKHYVDAVVGQTDIPVAEELNSIENSVGLNEDGTIVSGGSSVWGTERKYFTSATTVVDAVKALDDNLSALSGVVEGLDFELAPDVNKVLDSIKQENGQVSATSVNLTSVKISGYTVGGDDSGKVADTDTLGEALGKLQGQINGMDKDAEALTGQIVTTVSEEDGKVSETKAYLKDITLSGYSKTNADGAITDADTLEVALSKLENKVGANQVTNTDSSITINTEGATTDISVNIKSGEKVLAKDNTTGGLYTDIKLSAITPSSENVREEYALIATDGTTPLGTSIKIYKDSSLVNFYLGHTDDKLTNESGDTHESPDSAVTEGTGSTALVYIVQLADGNYKLTAVDVESFLQEAEFKDGLQVSAHTVSVKVDSTSEKVVTAYNETGNTEADVLTVSENGVKVANIQGAIDAAVSKAQTTVDTAVTSSAETVHNHLTIAETVADNGQKSYKFTTFDIASDEELKAEEQRAKDAEAALDGVIGSVKDASAETRTYEHSGTNYLDNSTTVKNDVEALDTLLGKVVSDPAGAYDVEFTPTNTVAKQISDIKSELNKAVSGLTLSSTTTTPEYISTSVVTAQTGTTITINAIKTNLATLSSSGNTALVDAWDAKQYFVHDVKDDTTGANKVNVSVVSGSTGEQIIDFTNMVVDCGTF